MASKRYNTALWIVGLLLIAGFGYYFLTVLFMGSWRSFKPKVKLTMAEKEMIEKFESECNCEVKLQHKYYLINNEAGNHFNSRDSVINILFRNDPYKTILPCGYSDDVLIAHATDVANRMIKTISHKNYYIYLNVHYSSYRKGDVQSSTCSKRAKFKLTEQKAIEFISLN